MDNSKYELLGQTDFDIDLSEYVKNTRKIGNVSLSSDIPVTLTGDSAITVTNTGTASAIGYSVVHKDSGVTAGSKGDTTNQTPGFGGTFKVLSTTVDAKGHVTNISEHSVQIPDTEATQSAKGLMSPADKKKLDTLIDPTLSNAGQAADAKATGDKFSALQSLIRRMEIHCTASGNPATFSDATAANVKALSVTITPTQSGSGDPSPSNVRPISGVSSVTVTRTKKNLFDGTFVSGTIDVNGNLVPNSSRWSSANFILVNPDTAYALSRSPAFWGAVWHWYDAQKNYINSESGSTATHISPTDARFLRITTDSDPDGKTFQLEYGTVPIAYEPYQGQSVTVQLTDGSNPLTVYGGTLDVTTGKLAVTRQIITVSASDSWGWYAAGPSATLSNVLGGRKLGSNVLYGVCNMVPSNNASMIIPNYLSAAGTSSYSLEVKSLASFWGLTDVSLEGWKAFLANNPLQIAYDLENPVTYQLTPQQLATLSGYNAVSTDATSVSVTYKADSTLVLGGAV